MSLAELPPQDVPPIDVFDEGFQRELLTICQLMGMPTEDWRLLRDWSARLLPNHPREVPASDRAVSGVSEDDYPHVIAPTLALLAESPLLGGLGPGERGTGDPRPLSPRGAPEPERRAGRGRRRLRLHHQRRQDDRPRTGAVRPRPRVGLRVGRPGLPVSWPEVSFPYGLGHVQELQYLFRGFHGGSGIERELSPPSQQELAREIVRYWTTFARHGTPNDEAVGLPEWPAYVTDRDNVMALCLPHPTVMENVGAAHHRDFWDQFWA